MVFKREHGREGEWVACEMQASSPMNSWRMFQLELAGFIKVCSLMYLLIVILDLLVCLFIPSIGLYAVTGETGVSPTKAMAAGVSAQLMRQHAKFHDFKLK
ncbi:unnamed protein product [Prunus armeniaca]|uniref:Uncharacterized protein n=1 Tax=Prunus armeniaca TaxID=36596 RepID=A0A6J5U3C6_PRUAR|nr:unnamed protein product [Prunus armeniaca]